jgi:hypothetical protein
MMKGLCLVLTLSLLCLIANAQTLYPRIGITASVNTYRPQNYDMTPKAGFILGLGYNLALSEVISVQAELDFVQKSFETDYSNTTTIQYGEDLYALHEKGSGQYAISYLELPLLVKARVLHDNFFVLGGFSIGMGLGGSHKFTYESTSSYLDPVYEEGSGKIKFGDASSTTNEDVYFDNRWDIGFQVGLGALILKKLQVECRYGLGMVNVNKDTDSKNHCVQISFSTPIQL